MGSIMRIPKGQANALSLRFQFDHCLNLKFLGAWMSSNARLLTYRELGDAVGLATLIGSRRGRNIGQAR
jgi:hypothetical protein